MRTPEPPKRQQRERSESYYDTKSQVFSALIDTIDLSQLAKLEPDSAREEIRDIVNDIIAIKNFAMSIAEQEELLEDICNDVLGYGPQEPLLARDDIADIMVNGAKQVFIEVNGKVEQTSIRFRDNQQLLNICQRIVSQVGRRVDEASPICDARLRDGSRRITHITEVIGMEGDVIITQDLVLYNIKGEDSAGRLIGEHVSTGIGRPHFWDRARYYGEEQRLAKALEDMEKRD